MDPEILRSDVLRDRSSDADVLDSPRPARCRPRCRRGGPWTARPPWRRPRRAGRTTAAPSARLSRPTGAVHGRDAGRCVLGTADRDQPDGLDPDRAAAMRIDRTRRQLPACGAGAAGRAARRHESARLPVRRLGSVQGHRGRVVRPQRAPGCEARCLRRPVDRDHRGGPGTRRLSLYDADDQPCRTASMGRQGAVGVRARRQPRVVQPRTPVRGGGCALPVHGQADAARRGRARR